MSDLHYIFYISPPLSLTFRQKHFSKNKSLAAMQHATAIRQGPTL